MAKDVESDIEVVRHDGNKDVASSASSNDLDDTYNLYKQQNMDNVDPQEASRVLRRIDYHILPILMMTYMLQYLDKSSINFASVHGLRQGTRRAVPCWLCPAKVTIGEVHRCYDSGLGDSDYYDAGLYEFCGYCDE